MNRRAFLERSLLGTIGGVAFSGFSIPKTSSSMTRYAAPGGYDLNFSKHAAELRSMLFDEYLPFWERGGYDVDNGGFMCYLHDDGSVQDDRKDIWYQGRGIWVYSYLYNRLDRNPKWLEMASKTRDFMVEYMHRGDGTWLDTVDRLGNPVSGIDESRDGNIYGALFAAVGLIQLAGATGSEADFQLAKLSIRKSVERYEDPEYAGVTLPETTAKGLRAQGHSFMLVWVIPQLLEVDPNPDPWFESLAREHLDLIENRFWNPEFGISNEVLFHDYSRIPGLEDHMVPGHSIETQWMAAAAAGQFGETARQSVFRDRMRRLIEMNWDYVFGGIGDTSFRVFESETNSIGPDFSIKAMWAQTEVLVGCLRAYADTGEGWALDWYQKMWSYLKETMMTDYGVWIQAANRRGLPIDRPGISPFRKGNFHQPRCLMMNLLDLERLVATRR